MTELDEGRRLARLTGRVFATAFGSQVAAAVAIASTSLLGLAVSDAYAIGLQVGNGALTGVALGIVYFLAIGRPGFDAWRRWKVLAIGYSIALVAVTVAFIVIRNSGDHVSTTLAVTCVLGAGGACMGIAGIDAVREACLGRPLRISSLTIVPNVCLIIGTLLALLLDGSARSVVPAAAWTIGCVFILVSGARARSSVGSNTPAPPPHDSHRLHALGLAVGTIVSTFMPPLFLTAVAHLEPGTATALVLLTRVGGSAVGLTANSILVSRYSWTQTSAFQPSVFEKILVASLGFFAAGLVLDAAGITLGAVAAGLAWWLLALVPTPFINREINAQRRSRSVLLKGCVDLAFALIALSILLVAPSPLGYLAVFVISQGLTVVIGATALRHTRLAFLAGLLLISGWGALILGAL